MAVIGALTAVFRADTRPLTKALRGAEAQAAAVGVRLNRVTSVKPDASGIKAAEAQVRKLAEAYNQTVAKIEQMKAAGASADALKPLTNEAAATRREMNALGKDLTEAKARFADANASAEKLKNTLSRIGAVTGGLLLAGVAGATREIKKLGDQAETFDNLRNATGLTIDQLGELKYLAEENGWSFEAMTKSAQKLVMNLIGIEDGTGRAGEAAARLGIRIRDANGQLLPMSQLWPQVIDRLRQVPDATERAALAAQLFGKSFGEIMPLIAMTTAEVRAQVDGAKEFGAVYNESLHQIGMQADDVFDRFTKALSGAQVSLTKAVAPMLLVVTHMVTHIAESLSKWTLNLSPAKMGFATMLATAVALIPVVLKGVILFNQLRNSIAMAGGVLALITGNWQALLIGLGAVVGLSAWAGHMAEKEKKSLDKMLAQADKGTSIGKTLKAAQTEIGKALPETGETAAQASSMPSSASIAATGSAELGQILMVVTQIRDLVQRREQMTRSQMYAGSWG